MLLAIVVTLAQEGLEGYLWIAPAMVIGAVAGAIGARRVKMTAMPQMVALFNGVGGGAVALIALGEFHNLAPAAGRLDLNLSVAMILSAIIGVDLVRRLADRVREAAGADRGATDRLSGSEDRERARDRRLRSCSRPSSSPAPRRSGSSSE